MVTRSKILLTILLAVGLAVGTGIFVFFYGGPRNQQILYPEEVLPRGDAQ